MEWVTSAHVSPTGDRVVLTARGQVFVIPAEQGRIVESTRDKTIRFREGRFFPDGKSLLALSDQSGELEFWKVPANGVGENTQLTTDGKVLRWDGIPSSDGKRIAHFDKDQQLWVYDIASKTNKRIAECGEGDFADVTLVARREVARVHGTRSKSDDSAVPLQSRHRSDYADHNRPVRQLQSGVVARRQVAVLPVGSELRFDHSQPMGIATARAVLRQADEDLSGLAEARRTIAIPA